MLTFESHKPAWNTDHLYMQTTENVFKGTTVIHRP